MNEFDFIERLRSQTQSRKHSTRILTGIGDDAAIISESAGRDLIVTTDLLIEDVDFHRRATPLQGPDLTVLLRVDPEVGLGRAAGDDRFESEGVELQRAVAEAYEEIATIAADRVVAVDASGSVEEVHARILEVVRSRSA